MSHLTQHSLRTPERLLVITAVEETEGQVGEDVSVGGVQGMS